VSLIGHANSVSGAFKDHKKRWHCDIQKWNEKIEKGHFRNTKRLRRPMKAKSADLGETTCDVDKIKEFQVVLHHLSEKELLSH
jgi:hypothetical protein